MAVQAFVHASEKGGPGLGNSRLRVVKGQAVSEGTLHQGPRMVRQRVGPTLRSMRLRRHYSLNELALRAGISPSHLSRIERGLTVPSYEVLDNIAIALGSDLNSLRSIEKSARAVDDELRIMFDRLKIGEEAQQELLGLSHETREALADALAGTLPPAP
jgi:transcriptional regulator with XRE-family HTH domain